ncbi:hypothetical protein GSI_08795 [Ganoderma sinense ZZ0214-1]|uniref:DUF8212 domain-containing protein n=1 Tax=Ganoderma sinense ZZ0214-1 TaxID=1077348 RepID=A0A2G8S4S2_9APHY|nr:hypothetical protein GSI_08795 [Ganoderma sinense ZZ0214-1]
MALLHLESLDKFSVSQRLSWAAKRETKRMEDQAYSLLGIFDINMPTLYGEGNRAFRRLLEQIMQRTPDQSLFAWGDVYLGPQILPLPSAGAAGVQDPQSFECFTYTEFPSLLAIQPSLFMNSGSIRAAPLDTVREIQTHKAHHHEIEYTSTPYGIRTQFQMIPLSNCFPSRSIRYDSQGMEVWQWYLAILGCEHKDPPAGHLLGRVCFIPPSERGVEFLYPGFVCISSSKAQHDRDDRWADHFPLSPDTIKRARGLRVVEAKTVYLAHPSRAPTPAPDALLQQRERSTVTLVLLPETSAALLASGYIAELRGPMQLQDAGRPGMGTHRLALAQDSAANDADEQGGGLGIVVEFEHALEEDGKRFTITARITVEMSEPLAVGTTQPAAEPDTVSWTDGRPWGAKLMRERVKVQGGGAGELVLDLGLDFAGMGIYFLRVDVLSDAAVLGAVSSTLSDKALQSGRRRVASTGSEGSTGAEGAKGRLGYWRQVAFWRAA